VKSDDEPFIQWLKRVESDNTQLFPISDAPITVSKCNFKYIDLKMQNTKTIKILDHSKI